MHIPVTYRHTFIIYNSNSCQFIYEFRTTSSEIIISLIVYNEKKEKFIRFESTQFHLWKHMWSHERM